MNGTGGEDGFEYRLATVFAVQTAQATLHIKAGESHVQHLS